MRALRRAICRALLAVLLAVHLTPPQLLPLAPPIPRRLGPRPVPACSPLSSPVEGTWVREEATPSSPVRLFFTPHINCAYSVSSVSAFFSAFDGRTIAFAGDSQTREWVFDFVAHVHNCCDAQPTIPCDRSLERDADQCVAIQRAESYPVVPPVWVLKRGSAVVRLIFIWVAFAYELPQALDGPVAASLNASTSMGWIADFLRGRVYADSLVLAVGVWDLIYDRTRRSDSLQGLTDLTAGMDVFTALFAAAADANPSLRLRERFIWRRMFEDEVDCIPHPKRDTMTKRIIMRPFFTQAINATRVLWQRAGVVEWDVSGLTDARRGGATRPMNTEFLTYDGQHVYRDVNIALGWEVLSYISERVLRPAAEAAAMAAAATEAAEAAAVAAAV